MHVVIPTADEPRNPSLPYALASIREHTDYTPITIGKDWGLCDHIPSAQGRDKFANTDTAMRIACTELGEEFVWSNDDIYWLRPAEPIRWAIGRLEDAKGSSIYSKRKRATADNLACSGLTTWDYEAHVPMLIHPEPMLHTLSLVRLNPMLDKRSLYGNLTGTPDHIGPDVKIRSRNQRPSNAAWYSTATHIRSR